jgi:hypothetical protein
MSSTDVEGFVGRLEGDGLTFVRNVKAIDIANFKTNTLYNPLIGAENGR